MPAALVVDDDLNFRRLMCFLLVSEGYIVQSAEHGGPALDILRTTRFRFVVLLGLNMPGVSGKEFLEAVVADEALATRHAYIVVSGASSVATEGRVRELRDLLNVPFIHKPFDFDRLIDAVDEAAARLDGK